MNWAGRRALPFATGWPRPIAGSKPRFIPSKQPSLLRRAEAVERNSGSDCRIEGGERVLTPVANLIGSSETNNAVEEHEPGAMGVLGYSACLRHRRLLLGCVAAGFAVFAAIAWLLPAGYDSTAQLMPPDQSSSMSGLMNAASERAQNIMGMSGDLLGGKTQGALFAKVMLSRTVEETLVDRFALRKHYRQRYAESARKRLESRTDISEDRKSGVITIRVRDRDPRRAHDLCQGYVDELNHLLTELHTSSARREREFLEQRLAVVRGEVDRTAAALGEFSSQHTTVDLPQQTRAMVD